MSNSPESFDHACVGKDLRILEDEFKNRPLTPAAMQRLRDLGGIGIRDLVGKCKAPDCDITFETGGEGRRLHVRGKALPAPLEGVVVYQPGMLHRGVVDPTKAYDPQEYFQNALAHDLAQTGTEVPAAVFDEEVIDADVH